MLRNLGGLIGLCVSLHAQCQLQWQSGMGIPGVEGGQILAMTSWDPDGAGPLQPLLVVGGDFRFAGDLVVNHLAAYDPAADAWSRWGVGTDAPVTAVLALPNGDLVIGGDFTLIDGVSANRVARWDGSAWHSLGAGVNGKVHCIASLPTGELAVGGEFSTAGGQPAGYIGRWDGASWSAFGSGLQGPTRTLVVLPSGNLVAGHLGYAGSDGIAVWSGSAWQSLGMGLNPGAAVYSMLLDANGDLVVGGSFQSAGGQPAASVARWTGVSWLPMDVISGTVRGLARDGSGALVAVGEFSTASGISVGNVARWTGASWQAMASGTSAYPNCATGFPGGRLFIGGSFVACLPRAARGLAEWSGGAWLPPARGFSGYVKSLLVLPDGSLVAGGAFDRIGDVPARGIAMWDGFTWAQVGAGIRGDVVALLSLGGGRVVAGGSLFSNGVIQDNVALWDGLAWQSMGSGLNGSVSDLFKLPNGDLVAIGNFSASGGVSLAGVARWNGGAWSSLGSGPGSFASLRAGAVAANGDLVVGGIVGSNSGIWRWDGATWSMLVSGFSSNDIITRDNGEIWATGVYIGASVSTVIRIDGGGPVTVGVAAQPWRMMNLPGGDLLLLGEFASVSGVAASKMARWNGSVWAPLVSGLGLTAVWATAIDNAGDLVFGGQFVVAGGNVSAFLARLRSSCPPATNAAGAGCPSSGGANSLVATSNPWLGASFTASASGLPTLAIVARVTGFGSLQLPLSQILPTGVVGCELRATPDLVDPVLTTNGTAESSIALPNSASLAGMQLYHQMIPLELDGGGNIVAVTATNALQLTLGTL